MNNTQNEHPWVKTARQAKEAATQEPEPGDEQLSAAPSGLVFFSAVFLLLLVAAVSVSMYLLKKQTASVTHSHAETVLVWHAGRADEAAQLQLWANAFSAETGIQVKIEAQSDLQTSLIRAMFSDHAPGLAIVDADLAKQLAASGVLQPLHPSSKQTYLPLARETTWTRAQVLVAPRGKQLSASLRRFIDYIDQQLPASEPPLPSRSDLPKTSTLR